MTWKLAASPPLWYCAFWFFVFPPVFWTVGYFVIKWAIRAAR